MLYLIDKGDNWSWIDNDLVTIRYEDGTTEPLESRHLEVEMGKYKGTLLSNLDDESYLRWMLKTATENDSPFVMKCLEKRLEELV